MAGNSSSADVGRRFVRGLAALAFGALSAFFAITAAITTVKGLGSPAVVTIEVAIAVLFGVGFWAIGRRD